jgi:gluconokinase
MRGHHQQSHFTRAVIEGISIALYDIAHNMIEAGLSVNQVHVSGGFVHSEAWLQILTNIFGKKICLINTADASAVGAAFLALKNLGIISDYLALKPTGAREFLPESEHMEVYRELFVNYRNLYEHVKPLMSRSWS